MGRQLFLAALGGGLLTLAVAGGLLALDRTVLHVLYTDEDAIERSVPVPTRIATRWYYVGDGVAATIAARYRGSLPTCNTLFSLDKSPLPASPGAAPIVEDLTNDGRFQGIGGLSRSTRVQVAVECRQ